MKAMKFLEFLLSLVSFYLVSLLFSYSIGYQDFSQPTNCSYVWNTNCNATYEIDNAFGPPYLSPYLTFCNGTRHGTDDHVVEVHVNASAIKPGDGINVTCEFYEVQWGPGYNTSEYVFYWNTTDWIVIWKQTFDTSNFGSNITSRSFTFPVNFSEGSHIVRCAIVYHKKYLAPDPATHNYCMNSTTGIYDNDDVNFTVTTPLEYSSWNFTNSTGGNATGQTFNRTVNNNPVYLYAKAHWNKNISEAFIEHNGTGVWRNYTICTYPNCLGNWTNYTLNLTNASEFNRKTIALRIWANDTGVWGFVNTSPFYYFHLDPGLKPNITTFWFSPANKTNLYTNLTIYANVSDDVGIYRVVANVTYPQNQKSVLLNLTGSPFPGNQTWHYTFTTQTNPLNETGTYTVNWIKVYDSGDQEVNLTQPSNFTVVNELNFSVSIDPSTPSQEAWFKVNVSILDINQNFHQFPVNLTVVCQGNNPQTFTNVTQFKDNIDCKAPDAQTFYIYVNASDAYNNTGNETFYFHTKTSTSSTGGERTTGGAPAPSAAPSCIPEADYEINCTDEKDNDCDGATDCADPDCSSFPACIPEIKAFNLTLSQTEIEIEQGRNATIIASLKNIGNVPLILNLSLEKECCDISTQTSFSLEVDEEIDFPILIHVPLNQAIGEYLVTLNVKSGSTIKSKAFKIMVKQSTLLQSLQQVQDKFAQLESTLIQYQKLGVWLGNLGNLLKESKDYLNRANNAVNSDNLKLLQESLAKLQANLDSISKALPGLKYQKFLLENKWNITMVCIGTIFATYLVSQVIHPFYKLGLEIKNLSELEKSLVKARVEAEKQFFMRKIDEQTFQAIMIEKQGKILHARALIKKKLEERRNLLKERLHPMSMVRWVKSGFSKAKDSMKSVPEKLSEKLKEAKFKITYRLRR